ncbi:hypothetical protein YT14_002378 [Salmonella enterica subsp. enterica serovar Oslo]|nr:hypothetical protein [Salmonella enterica subsp. enterica serovar Oslo]
MSDNDKNNIFQEHLTTEGERWDHIAWRYYADPMGYGRIVLANPHIAVTPVLPGGLRLAIPVIDVSDVTEELPPWLR